MQPNSAPDIYLMKREKSRAGCMTVLFVTLAAVLVAAVFLLVHWFQNREVEPAPPLEMPEAPVEAKLVDAAPVIADLMAPAYTEEQLAAIADKQGIAGLREIAEPLGVKGNSIAGLISSILKAAGAPKGE